MLPIPTIRFEPLGIAVSVPNGSTILEATERSGVYLRHTCGGNMTCATCRATVVEGAANLSPMTRSERRRLAELCAPAAVRLSCQAQILGDVTVSIPVPRLGL